MGMPANGYNWIVGPVPNGIPSQLGGVVVDNNSLVSSGVTMDVNRNDVQNGVKGKHGLLTMFGYLFSG